MLSSHPRLAVPPETRFLVPVYYKRRTFGDMRIAERRRALAEYIAGDRSTKFRELGIDKDDYIRQVVEGPGSLGSVIGTTFKMYSDRFGKPRWGDKRPSYVKQVDMLTRLFPDAQFIHLIRDGRDCVASLKEMPWYTLNSFHAISTWAEAIDAGKRLRRDHVRGQLLRAALRGPDRRPVDGAEEALPLPRRGLRPRDVLAA
ncbi:hypothetical protein GCM10020219_037480 [Nonomuraea dietziae]